MPVLLPPMLYALLVSGLLLGGLTYLFRTGLADGRRIRPETNRKPLDSKFTRAAAINSVLSTSLIFGVTFGAYDYLFVEEPQGLALLAGQCAAVLLLYDFMYYLAHRFLFHRGILFKAHAVHHTRKYPQAVDSLYIHPVETAIGVLLLMLSVLIVGPIHFQAFAAAFVVYTVMNVYIHCGLNFDFFPLRGLSYMTRKHDTHHMGMRRGNYASITPIFDLLFGTAESA